MYGSFSSQRKNACSTHSEGRRRRSLSQKSAFGERSFEEGTYFARSRSDSKSSFVTQRAPPASKKCFALGLKIQGTLRRLRLQRSSSDSNSKSACGERLRRPSKKELTYFKKNDSKNPSRQKYILHIRKRTKCTSLKKYA
jgi:hypothetical protein